VAAESTTAEKNAAPPANSTVTGKGVVDFIPMWDATNDIIDSLIFQKSGSVGIATTAPAATLDVNGKSDVRDTLTLFPKGTDSTLTVNGTTFKIDQTGKVNFVTGQTFPGTGTITGVTTATGSGLTGGGTKGTLALGLTKTCSAKQVLQWNGTSWACSSTGSGTITGVTTASGSGLTGGGASGSLNLSLTTSCSSGQTLAWNGSTWACKTVGGSGTVTSVGLSAPSTDFTLSGSPVTSSGTLGLNWNVSPTSGNTANAIVKRDSNGSFNATDISAGGAVSAAGSLAVGGNSYLGGVVGIGTHSAQAAVNIDYGGTANSDSFLVGNTTKGLQLRDTGGAVDLESLGVPLFVNYATGASTYLFNLVGIGTSNPQVELNLNQGDRASNDALLIGNYSKGLQLRDTGAAVDLESWGVPLYVNGFTQWNTYLNPSGIISDGTNPNYGYGGVAIGSSAPSQFYPLTVSGGCCTSPERFAAIFWGDTIVENDFFVTGSKNFRIDHPLDPKNKYLQHAAIESSEVLNQYSGNVVLDDKGERRVEFPAWFAAINEDFRYQLTAIGSPGPNLYVSEEIKDNSFTIAGGRSGMKVSWQLTARRNDAYMKAHPYVVEQDKPEFERGYYTLPELYGAPKEEGIRYAQEQRSKEQQSKTTAPVKVKK
jgi:trimeric autotransporter adhesin